MSRPYLKSVIEEAARLFKTPVAHLFTGKECYAGVTDAQAALCYTFWLTQEQQLLASHVGREIHFGPSVAICTRLRNADQKYSDLVGELVWFAQRKAMAGTVAA